MRINLLFLKFKSCHYFENLFNSPYKFKLSALKMMAFTNYMFITKESHLGRLESFQYAFKIDKHSLFNIICVIIAGIEEIRRFLGIEALACGYHRGRSS